MRKKIDARIRTLVENCVKLRQRGLFVVIGDKARDQVVNLHYMLSKASVKARPSVSGCGAALGDVLLQGPVHEQVSGHGCGCGCVGGRGDGPQECWTCGGVTGRLHGIVWRGTAWHRMAWHGMTWCIIAWHAMM
eukprot:138014-Chlamydomonas_euryale.AAC.9